MTKSKVEPLASKKHQIETLVRNNEAVTTFDTLPLRATVIDNHVVGIAPSAKRSNAM
jgi:hypothetical protein